AEGGVTSRREGGRAGPASRPPPDRLFAPLFIAPPPFIATRPHAVKRPFLIGHKTPHASLAATTTATCSTVGLPHWPAASIHLTPRFLFPLAFQSQARLYRR
ncbi:hypothetical protein A6R68_13311, partial [Neotoma lepida]